MVARLPGRHDRHEGECGEIRMIAASAWEGTVKEKFLGEVCVRWEDRQERLKGEWGLELTSFKAASSRWWESAMIASLVSWRTS